MKRSGVRRSRSCSELAGEVDEAKALREHPEILKLRELAALGEMARMGAKFVVGLPIDKNSVLLEADRGR